MLLDSLMAQIDARIADLMPSSPRAELLYDMARYHLGWVDEELRAVQGDAGKRIRSRLCLLSCAAAGAPPEVAMAPAVAVELIHNFSLIHDDIQDRSEYRRHRRTVWTIWGTSQAINAGDGLFALAQLALLSDERSDPHLVVKGVRVLNEACRALCEGQVLDLQFEDQLEPSPGQYYSMIEGKTAALLSASCQLGAVYGGAPDEVSEAFGVFGRYLGLAFQVRDDYLGIWGDPDETGKPVASDLTSKKKTLPLLYAISHASGQDKEAMQAILARPGPADEVETQLLLESLTSLGAADFTSREVERLAETAVQTLESAAPSSEARAEMAALCRRLSFRIR